MGPGLVMSHRQFAEEVWKDPFLLHCKQKSHFQFVRKETHEKRLLLLHLDGFLIICATTQ